MNAKLHALIHAMIYAGLIENKKRSIALCRYKDSRWKCEDIGKDKSEAEHVSESDGSID
jgi:hypothetical protein